MPRTNTETLLIAALAAAMFLSIPAQSAFAGDRDEKQFLYQWTDDRGSAHITDSLEKVPVKYRSKATRIDQGTSGGTDSSQMEPPPVEPRAFSLTEDDAAAQNEEDRKIEWQQRMYDARQRMTDAETRLQQYGARLKELQEKSGYGLYGYTPEAQAEATRLEGEIARAQADLVRAQNEVENVIPEQARKAGIPPGWLREVQ